MKTLNNKTVVVAGGTGNVGSIIVKELLSRGATVAVPSRSEEKLEDFKTFLKTHVDQPALDRLHTFVGNIGEEGEAEKILQQITADVGIPDAAIASLGHFLPAPSLLDATVDDLQQVINSYLISHFVVARAFLKRFKERNSGTYIFINGPLALEPWEGSAAGLVSTVTAGQQMLFKTMAQEFKESDASISELINYAYIRDRTTQPSSSIPGEATGAYAAYLMSDAAKDIHGQSIRLKSTEQLDAVGIDPAV